MPATMHVTPAVGCAVRILLAASSGAITLDELYEGSSSRGLVQRTVEALCESRLLKKVGETYRLGFCDRAIRLSDVFAAVGLLPGPSACPTAAPGCSATAPCPLCWLLIEADIAALEVMRTQTLADLQRSLSVRPARCA
jgi:DNA-binding IscR family transcriptional regulator